MRNTSTSPLPPLYAGWFDDLLGGEIPEETSATCNDCAMCESQTDLTTSDRYFSPLAQTAYRKLIASDIPTRLRIGRFAVLAIDRGFYSLSTAGIGFDTLQLSERVMRLLPYFDGRPTQEIVNEIVEKESLRFTPGLLRRLVDFKVLSAVEDDSF
jgi:hypothetical protein